MLLFIMDKFVVIEVGSTNTKSCLYESGAVIEFPQKLIMFKDKAISNNLPESAVAQLIDYVNSFKDKTENIFIYGTSIFREIEGQVKGDFLEKFKKETGREFNIVSSEQEGEYTVKGVVGNNDYNGRLAIMIGGGGSIEVYIVENKRIIEKHHNKYGAIHVTREFEHINDFRPQLIYEEVEQFCLSRTADIKNKCDVLVLAGGDFKYFYQCAGSEFLQNNKFYDDINQPYIVNLKDMKKVDQRFVFEQDIKYYQENFTEMSPIWWSGARAMRFCVRAVVQKTCAKYIIPTKINMLLGIINELKNKEKS